MTTFKKIVKNKQLGENFIPNSFCGPISFLDGQHSFVDGSKEEEHHDCDECALKTDNCDANGACTNTVGSFTCACNTGYSGDGTDCTGVV